MTDPRKSIADAVRAAGGDFNRGGALAKFDDAMDALGVPRATSAAIGRSVGAAGVALVQEFEDYAKKLPNGDVTAYPDPGTGGDPWTIGWGSTGPGIKRGTVWTRAQADERFARDLAGFSGEVSRLLGSAPTTQNQFDAMVSLAYNIGIGNFTTSTLRRLHKEGDYDGAQAQFARWNKAAGKVLAGLTRRRAAEAALYGSA